MKPIVLSPEQIESYKRNGVLHVRNVVSPAVIESLRVELEKFVINEIKSKSGPVKSITRAGDEVNSIHFLSQVDGYHFDDYFDESSVDQLASQLLGQPAFHQLSESFLKPPFVGRKVFPHQDNEYFCLKSDLGINVITALDNTSRDNGTIYYYLGSHKARALEHDSLDLRTYTVEGNKQLEEYQKVYFDLAAGDCLFHDIHTVHGSDENLSPLKRRTITRLYSPFEEALDGERINLRIKRAYFQILPNLE